MLNKNIIKKGKDGNKWITSYRIVSYRLGGILYWKKVDNGPNKPKNNKVKNSKVKNSKVKNSKVKFNEINYVMWEVGHAPNEEYINTKLPKSLKDYSTIYIPLMYYQDPWSHSIENFAFAEIKKPKNMYEVLCRMEIALKKVAKRQHLKKCNINPSDFHSKFTYENAWGDHTGLNYFNFSKNYLTVHADS